MSAPLIENATRSLRETVLITVLHLSPLGTVSTTLPLANTCQCAGES